MSDESFRVHPTVVFRLGAELISDDVQALVELIKNSYDADATWARVTIETQQRPPRMDGRRPAAAGYIQVEDDGDGMDLQALRRGWLTIANSPKREMKRLGESTPKGRTPLGDKGLGRLGAQRLGYGLAIATKKRSARREIVAHFSWHDFEQMDSLEKVTATVTSKAPTREKGTTLLITDLRDPAWWRKADNEIQEELSRMVSPYPEISKDFRVVATLDGEGLDLQSLGPRIRETATLRYSFSFDGEELAIQGRARLGYLRPSKSDEVTLFRQLVEEDDGARFLQYLLQERDLGAKLGLKRVRGGGWFVRYARRRRLADMEPVTDADGEIASPGPFSGELDSYDLGAGSLEAVERGLFGKRSEYSDYIKGLGIDVYRDGFQIRTDEDWLQLGAQWTSARSYYTLRPDNTIGYVALSARDNPQLSETTDREGFIQNAFFDNFEALMSEVVRFAAEAQEQVRRGWLDFSKEHLHEAASEDGELPPEALTRDLEQTLERAAPLRAPVAELSTGLAGVATTTRDVKRALSGRGQRETRVVREALDELQQLAAKAKRLLPKVEHYLEESERQHAAATLLGAEIDSMREQLALSYETLSLGLTAEALSHEMFNLADRLNARTREVATYLRRRRNPDHEVAVFVEEVRGVANGLRKELAHFSPSLRWVRQRRDHIELKEYFNDVRSYYERRWKEAEVGLRIKSTRPFGVRMNRGKLTQITDNLLLNSEHWLLEALRLERIDRAQVRVELKAPFCLISDSGLGIEPAVEHSIFDPFVSAKSRDRGRGLGLFIVRQLLESEGCAIALRPERNRYGRRYVFELDLSGVRDDER